MASSYKARRVKLKNMGHDRHNKGIAFEMKAKRRNHAHLKQIGWLGLGRLTQRMR